MLLLLCIYYYYLLLKRSRNCKFQKVKESERERINKVEELDRKANVQLERQLVMASNWSRTLLSMQQKLKGTQWDPQNSHNIHYSQFLTLLNSNYVQYMDYSNYGQTVSGSLFFSFIFNFISFSIRFLVYFTIK